MTTQTTNYSFTKDNINEPYDVFRVNANLDAIDTEIKKKETLIGDKANLVTVTKTNLVAAINEVKEQTNDLANQTYKNLEYLTEGTLSAFILSKVNQGQSKGTFYCGQLSDIPSSIPVVANVRYSSNITLTGTIYVELFTGSKVYVNMLNASDGIWNAWTKLTTETEPTTFQATPKTNITLAINCIIKKHGFVYIVGAVRKTDGSVFTANTHIDVAAIPTNLQPLSGERITLSAFAGDMVNYFPKFTASAMIEATTIYVSTPIANSLEIGFAGVYYVGGGTL